MDDARVTQPSWLPDLMDRVRRALAALDEDQPDQQAAVAAELAELQASMAGWSQSLAKPDLPPELRADIEQRWHAAHQRQRSLQQAGRATAARQALAEQILDPAEVWRRIDRLADVLKNNNVTAGNLELSQHIDRIVCGPDGKVTVRTCQLGALTGAAEFVGELSAHGSALHQPGAPGAPPNSTGPRRRTRLRIANHDGNANQARALADYVADPDRFGNLGDEWFWIDEFQLPAKATWPESHATDVLRRYEELQRELGKRPSLTKLALEYGKSRPTITAALEIARNGAAPRQSSERKPRSAGVDAKAMAAEFARLERDEGLSVREIAERTGAHRNTVRRILKGWYAQQGLKREDGRTTRWRRNPPKGKSTEKSS